MICQVCGCEGELKVFSTFSYYYCGTCKDELRAMEPPTPTSSETHVGPLPEGDYEIFFNPLVVVRAPYFSMYTVHLFNGAFVSGTNQKDLTITYA